MAETAKQPAAKAPDQDTLDRTATINALTSEMGKKGYKENIGRAQQMFAELPEDRQKALEEVRFRNGTRALNVPEVARWFASPDRHPSEIAALPTDRLEMEFAVEGRLKQIEQAQKYLQRDSSDYQTLDREMKLLHGIRQRSCDT
jgi:hypothetical protein